jgi:transcriptional regulator with XRE-family HTH domain
MTQKSPRPVDRHVGQRLRLRRQILDVSQMDLARRLGITFQQVQKYEKGANRISASRLVEIAAALEVPVTYFFDGLDGAHEGGGKDDDLLIDSNGAALLRAFNRISDKAVQRALISLAQAASASTADGAQAADAGEANPQAPGAKRRRARR